MIVTASSSSGQQCVRCGKCLAVCPLYRLVRCEEYSPRGRVVLAEKSGGLDTVRCFGCLRCKSVCPYELSPLDRPGQRLAEDDAPERRSLFAFIYYRTPFPEDDLSHDPVAKAWFAARNGLPVDPAAPRFANGELFHPFLDTRAISLLEVMRNER